MKKYVFACVVVACLNACTYQNAQGLHSDNFAAGNHQAVAMERTVKNPSMKEVDIETARRMVHHFKDKETNRNLGGYVQFDPAELQELLNEPYIADVKLVHAAYLNSDPDANKRNVGTILICIKESAGATRYKYYTSSSICPPPDGTCSPEN